MEISLIFCLIVVALLVGCVIALVAVIRRMQMFQTEMEERVDQLSQMNAKLRASRHDALNQMQIVYGMAELGEYDELKEFLQPIYKDILKTSKALKTSIPAVNALIMAKSAEAEGAQISFCPEIKSSLKGIAMTDWELCRILGNLIDNAFRAVSDEGLSRREVLLDITETRDSYIIEVSDTGKGVPEAVRSRLFLPGFTTKKDEGHGMGLYIVSKLSAKYGGNASCTVADGRTNFTVNIPK